MKKFKLSIPRTAVISLLAILLGLLAGAVLMLLTGKDPVMGYVYLFKGGLMNIKRIGDTLATATALIFTGLSFAFAFRTGLFNIGSPGQFLMGGLFAIMIGLSFPLSQPVLLPFILVGSALAGGLWGAVSGLLKARFNVHEVVSGIMLNWTAYWIVYYIVPWYFKGDYVETESRRISDNASLKVQWLTDLFNGSYINLGLFIAILAAIIIAFILNRTTLGFELKSVGYNRHASEYAGMLVNKNMILAMAIAGALSGLAGAVYHVGYTNTIKIGVMPAQGFDGIAVSLLGANSPVGVVAASIFFGILYTGKGFMNANAKIPPEIADTIIATIIYFAATSVFIDRLLDRLKRKKKGVKS